MKLNLLFDGDDSIQYIGIFGSYGGRGGYLSRLSRVSAVVALHIDVQFFALSCSCVLHRSLNTLQDLKLTLQNARIFLIIHTVDSVRAEVPVSVELVDSASNLLPEYTLTSIIAKYRAWEQH